MKFPRIVITGMESSGKSSLLNLLAGRKLFAVGMSSTTRCPYILEMENGPFKLTFDGQDIRLEDL